MMLSTFSFYNANDMVAFIKQNLTYAGGDTNTTGGLDVALNVILNQDGDRRSMRDVIILLTDGIPTFPEPNPR